MYSPESGNWPLQYLKTNTRKLWGFRERERERERGNFSGETTYKI